MTSAECTPSRSASAQAASTAGTPHGHWKTTTFLAGLRLSGLAALFVLDGPINRDAFQTYVERVLVPELAPATPS